jgi:cellobiose-specific phosphotransferase system component IIC
MDWKKKVLVLDTIATLLWATAIALNIVDTYFTLLPVTAPTLMPLIVYRFLSVLLLTASFFLFILSIILYQPFYTEKNIENNKE